MKTSISTLFTIVIVICKLQAQSWMPCNLATNGNSTNGTAVCVHNGKLFATNNSNGLQISNDNGATWTVVNTAITSPGVNLYSTGDRLYSLLHNSGCTYIQYSTDDGVTFQIDTAGLPLCYANASTIPSSGGVSWNNHLMFSLAGPDWEFTRNTANPGWDDADYFDANDCSEFFVKNDTCWAATNGATSNGVAWSTDGLNWTSPSTTGLPVYYVPSQIAWNNNRLFMMGADVGAGNAGKDTILKYSDDFGITFQDVNIKQYLASPTQATLDIFVGYNHVYLTLNNNLWGSAPDLIVSTDGGQTFTTDTTGFPNVVNTIFTIKEMVFLNGWAFAQVNSGDLYRKQIGAVGIVENNNTNLYSVYPNPADNQLTIKTESRVKQVTIMDITGKVVVAETKNTIDISTLDAGIYSITIETESTIHNTTFVKK